MTFGFECCWCSIPTIPKLKSWEENEVWPVGEESIRNRVGRPALIPVLKQTRCCSLKGRWRSSGQMVALHVHLCLHHMFSASLDSKVSGDVKPCQRYSCMTLIRRGRKKCEIKKNSLHTHKAYVKNKPKCGVSSKFCKTCPISLIRMRQETKRRFAVIKHTPVTGLNQLVLWILYVITMLQRVPLPSAGLCLCLSVCKPDWPCWMRIPQTGWHVVYRPVLSPFTRWFSAHISEDDSSSMAPGDVLWQGMRKRAAKWIQGWAKRSFQRRLQRDERERRRRGIHN